MAAYNYKYVRDLLPPYLTTDDPEYEGTVDYDGDMWAAAACYIEALEKELAKQYTETGNMTDGALFAWLTGRRKTSYCNGPAIIKDTI